MNYCGDCEHLDEETFDRDKSRRCPLQQFYVFADHPACRKFEAKKQGICKVPCIVERHLSSPLHCDNDSCKYNFKETNV